MTIMACVWFRCLMIITLLQACVYVGVDAQSLSDKDITREVLHRLDELERQVKQQRAEITTLRGENIEFKSLRKFDAEMFRKQNIELGRLRKENVQFRKEIDRLKDRDNQLEAKINLLENRDRATSENVTHLKLQINDVNDANEANVRKNDKVDVQDVNTGKSETTDDKRELVSDDKERAIYNRIRRYPEQGGTIAFFATRSGHAEHLGQHQAVVFDKAITNIGQGYHNTTGIFTAPVAGVYVFSTTILAYNEAAHFNFVVNGKVYTWMYAHGTETFETMSQNLIFNLAKGDDVSIQSADGDKFVFGQAYSMFSGFLLVPTEENAIVG